MFSQFSPSSLERQRIEEREKTESRNVSLANAGFSNSNNPHAVHNGMKYEKLKSGAFNVLKGTACVVAAVAAEALLTLSIGGIGLAGCFFLPALALLPIPILLALPVCFGARGLFFLAGQQFKQAKDDFVDYCKL